MIKIIQICVSNELGYQSQIIGLGEDSLIYFWSEKRGGWILLKI